MSPPIGVVADYDLFPIAATNLVVSKNTTALPHGSGGWKCDTSPAGARRRPSGDSRGELIP